MPSTYVLDSDELILLYKHMGAPLAAVGRLPVIIPELVWNEVIKGGQFAAERAAFMTAIAGGPTAWTLASAEHAIFSRLFSGVEAKLGDGERAAIAYAFVHPPAVVVTADQLALKQAIEHLRGRVLSAFGLLDALIAQGQLSQTVLSEFTKKYVASGQAQAHPKPLWADS